MISSSSNKGLNGIVQNRTYPFLWRVSCNFNNCDFNVELIVGRFYIKNGLFKYVGGITLIENYNPVYLI